jgi:hypothetical protein
LVVVVLWGALAVNHQLEELQRLRMTVVVALRAVHQEFRDQAVAVALLLLLLEAEYPLL